MGTPTTIHTTLITTDDPHGIVKPVISKHFPKRLQFQLYNILGHTRLRMRGETNGLRCVEPGDICYFWPNSSANALRRARGRRGIVVIELINTHVGLAERIMEAERRNYGLAGNPLRDRLLREEEERLQLADFAFAPGPFVGSSIREFSKADVGILETSYGAYVPDDLPPKIKNISPRPRFVFVGTFGLRKGARTLLDAWDLADLDAELHIFGGIEEMFKDEVARRATRHVVYRGYAENVSQAYREADIFVFPSLEEGGPQVTYEAAAHGLPLVVTPMGGGRIADETNGIIVAPGDSQALADALTLLTHDADLRARLGSVARAAAPRYNWTAVARQRLTALMGAVGERATLRGSLAKA